MEAVLHIWLSQKTASVVLESMAPDLLDTRFEKRAQTRYEKTAFGLDCRVRADDEKAMHASIHFAVKNISFLLSMESFARGSI
ncbi:MAG: hypothetical protein Q7R47_01725 [Candidatus Diapherotrites archaeon]|nr:hypothetical protein [Candidatus Diapherotrites archaeon]